MTNLARLVVGIALLTSTGRVALSAGFAIEDHPASQTGAADAGAAAAAEDAGTIADNPAGIARLSGAQTVLSTVLVGSTLPFANTGSRLADGAAIGGNSDGGTLAPLPNLFFAAPATERLSIGLGLSPNFGLATTYPSGWVGRYLALTTRLTTFDIAPTVAYKVTPRLSIGVSPVARYSKFKASNAIDFGAIAAASGVPGAVPGGADGGVLLRASGWSFGFNGGALWEPIDGTRLGIAYFHNDAAGLGGTASFRRPRLGEAIAAASGAFVDGDISGLASYPDRLNLGVVQSLSADIDIRAGFTWTQWSSFKELRIVFVNPRQPDAVTDESWHDSYSVSLGGTYRAMPELILRAGVAYDQTPIPDPAHRTPRIPDTDRIAVAIGAGYALTPTTTVDAAYKHLFGMREGINIAGPTGDRLVGSTRLSADVFALQLTFRY